MIVIGLAGPAGSGKSTVAGYLARTYGARLFAFAEPLKRLISLAFPEVPYESLYGTQEEKERPITALGGLSGRDLMQRIGTNGIRNVFGKDFWVRRTLEAIAEARASLVVIEDVRFLSEAAGVREWCGVFAAKVRARGVIQWPGHGHAPDPCYIIRLDHSWLAPTADPSHQSEAEWRLIEADHVIATPTKSLESLYQEVDRACVRFGILPALHSVEAP